jgi:hypothetical protein
LDVLPHSTYGDSWHKHPGTFFFTKNEKSTQDFKVPKLVKRSLIEKKKARRQRSACVEKSPSKFQLLFCKIGSPFVNVHL